VFGQTGNDTISLDEANGTLPAANLFGGAGDDVQMWASLRPQWKDDSRPAGATRMTGRSNG
jgi:hypothetical protein